MTTAQSVSTSALTATPSRTPITMILCAFQNVENPSRPVTSPHIRFIFHCRAESGLSQHDHNRYHTISLMHTTP
uniref:Uncharacterized protein n=1 Tax=Anguilla anguilla TaxID=7936 RepID=A0A0E9P775_ANGAN